jgi:hypothetical protein
MPCMSQSSLARSWDCRTGIKGPVVGAATLSRHGVTDFSSSLQWVRWIEDCALCRLRTLRNPNTAEMMVGLVLVGGDEAVDVSDQLGMAGKGHALGRPAGQGQPDVDLDSTTGTDEAGGCRSFHEAPARSNSLCNRSENQVATRRGDKLASMSGDATSSPAA